MEIIPGLLGEAEFLLFSEADYANLKNVLNDVLAIYICDYTKNPNADPVIVENINKYMDKALESFTMHLILEQRGIIDLLRTLAPNGLLLPNVNLDDIIDKLSYLYDNKEKILYYLPRRDKEHWTDFKQSIKDVLERQRANGVKPTFPDIMKRIEANKFIFYNPNVKDIKTNAQIVLSRHTLWLEELRGAQYLRYCNDKGITVRDRRAF